MLKGASANYESALRYRRDQSGRFSVQRFRRSLFNACDITGGSIRRKEKMNDEHTSQSNKYHATPSSA